MRTEWGQAKSTGVQPVYTYALVLISLVAALGIQGFRLHAVWTPLERHYLPAYLGSQMAGVVRDNGSYTLLQVVTRKGSRVALDSDVVPAMSNSGENTYALTEEAVKHGALRLELHRAYYNNAEMHSYLGKLIIRTKSRGASPTSVVGRAGSVSSRGCCQRPIWTTGVPLCCATGGDREAVS